MIQETKKEDALLTKKEVGSPESAALNAPPQQAQIHLISAWLAALLCLRYVQNMYFLSRVMGFYM